MQINVTEEDEIYHSFYGLRIYFVRNQCNLINTNLQMIYLEQRFLHLLSNTTVKNLISRYENFDKEFA